MRRRVEAGRIWERGTEWNAGRALLAHEGLTEMGRGRATGSGSPPLERVPDVRPLLDRCRAAGSVLDGADLIQFIPVIDAAPRLTAYGHATRTASPDVATLTDALPRAPEVGDRLRLALDEAGAVHDDASPALRRLRREIRERRRRVAAGLERLLQTNDADRIFADRYVTIRHGRYVLPVRAEARGRVSGIVHDRSQSGQTLFVEPAEVVEANNDLVQAVREEEHETARILAELTSAVRGRAHDLARLVEAIGELDWIFARAAAADRMGATPPALDAGRTLALKNARHPLLLAQHWRDPSPPAVPAGNALNPGPPPPLLPRPHARGQNVALQTAAAPAA